MLASVLVWSGFVSFLGWLWSFWGWLWHLSAPQVAVIQTALLAIGGIWAFRLYRMHREGQPKVDLTPGWKLVRTGHPWAARRTILVLRVRMVNSSRVLIKGLMANATVTDYSHADAAGNPVPRPWRVVDLMAFEDQVSVDEAGKVTFVRDTAQSLIEPGERVDSEVALTLKGRQGLLGVKVEARSERGGWDIAWTHLLHHRELGWNPRERLYWEWSSFFFIDPSQRSGGGASPPL